MPSSPSASVFPASGTFPVSCLFTPDDQNTEASASVSVLPVNIPGWSPLRLTGLISLLSTGLSRVFSSTTVWRHQCFGSPALTTVCDHWEYHSLDFMNLCQQSNVSLFNTPSRFVIAFLPINNRLLISWLQSPSAVILEPKKRKSGTTSAFSPCVCHMVMGADALILVLFIYLFLILSLKPTLSLSSLTLIKRLFSFSLLSAFRVVSSTYLRLLMFLSPILIPACNSSKPTFLMMCSAYRLSK